MNSKAKFISAAGQDLIYKYRGHEYMIHNYGWLGVGSGSESLQTQHKEAQNRIDGIIEERSKTKDKNTIGEDIMTVLDECFEW